MFSRAASSGRGRKMALCFAASLILTGGAGACAGGDATPGANRGPSTSQTMNGDSSQQHVHRNNLMVKLPASLAVKETSDGFLIEPADGSNARARRPVAATVERRAAASFKVPADAEQKTVNGRLINYAVATEEGGSGGAEHTLTAWETTNDGLVVYRQTEQSEHETPRFELCWQVIENTAVK